MSKKGISVTEVKVFVAKHRISFSVWCRVRNIKPSKATFHHQRMFFNHLGGFKIKEISFHQGLDKDKPCKYTGVIRKHCTCIRCVRGKKVNK